MEAKKVTIQPFMSFGSPPIGGINIFVRGLSQTDLQYFLQLLRSPDRILELTVSADSQQAMILPHKLEVQDLVVYPDKQTRDFLA